MIQTDAPNVVTQSMWRDSNALPRSINAKLTISLAISQACATKRNMHTPNQGDLRCTNCKQVPFMHAAICHVDHLDDDSTANDSFCLQVMIKCNLKEEQRVPRPTHLITNLAYRLQPHHHRNLYLRARLDTCTDVNLMPASVYQLVFNDLNMKKIVPSKLQVGTYMIDTMKIVGSCTFCLLHPDTKRLLETPFTWWWMMGVCCCHAKWLYFWA